MLKQIAVMVFLLGVVGVAGPSLGVVLRGTTVEQSRMAGMFLMGSGVVIGLLAFGVGALQTKSKKGAKGTKS